MTPNPPSAVKEVRCTRCNRKLNRQDRQRFKERRMLNAPLGKLTSDDVFPKCSPCIESQKEFSNLCDFITQKGRYAR